MKSTDLAGCNITFIILVALSLVVEAALAAKMDKKQQQQPVPYTFTPSLAPVVSSASPNSQKDTHFEFSITETLAPAGGQKNPAPSTKPPKNNFGGFSVTQTLAPKPKKQHSSSSNNELGFSITESLNPTEVKHAHTPTTAPSTKPKNNFGGFSVTQTLAPKGKKQQQQRNNDNDLGSWTTTLVAVHGDGYTVSQTLPLQPATTKKNSPTKPGGSSASSANATADDGTGTLHSTTAFILFFFCGFCACAVLFTAVLMCIRCHKKNTAEEEKRQQRTKRKEAAIVGGCVVVDILAEQRNNHHSAHQDDAAAELSKPLVGQ